MLAACIPSRNTGEHRGKNKFWVQMQVKRYFNKHKRQTLSKNRTETINTGRQSGGSVVFK